jgi:hypothetical protein
MPEGPASRTSPTARRYLAAGPRSGVPGPQHAARAERARRPRWERRLTADDRRALTPLFSSHVNLYGRFSIDMSTHLDLEAA